MPLFHIFYITLISYWLQNASAASHTQDGDFCPKPEGESCTVRTYYIQAEEVDWDYAPSGRDAWAGVPLEDSDAAIFTEEFIGRTYKKTIYFQYTSSDFDEDSRVEKETWMGNLGPVIRAEVGDIIKVVFRNSATVDLSMHPHGLRYSRASEGASHAHATDGDAISPGDEYTYTWSVPESAGPGSSEEHSKFWMYHSHVTEDADIYGGAIGPIIIYEPGILDSEESTARPTTSDSFPYHREYILHLLVTNEGASSLFNETLIPDDAEGNEEDFEESNLMHAINGYLYANLEGLVVIRGERVRWYVTAFGNEVDLHTLHWHHATLEHRGQRKDVIQLLPADFEVATMDFTEDLEAGSWPLHCHVMDHMNAGMNAFYEVRDPEEGESIEAVGSASTAVVSISLLIMSLLANL